MTTLPYWIGYLSVVVFLGAVGWRIARYRSYPLHLRWELYPVPHEGERSAYGGSYLEEVDWSKKPRHTSKATELRVMLAEILLLKAVWEHNRPLWWVSYPFHLGLYLLVAFVVLLLGTSVGSLGGGPDFLESSTGATLTAVLDLLGPAAFALTGLGALGLLYRRWTSPELRPYTSAGHTFNLLWFAGVMAVALATWARQGQSFAATIGFVENWLSFRMEPVGSRLLAAEIVLSFALVAYIPLTHMAHFFMKYFLYHDIRWEDTPNLAGTGIKEKVDAALTLPVSWAAPHVLADGKSTWADVATKNPSTVAAAKKD